MADASADDIDRHVRRVDPDRWLAARLVADPAARAEVLALYALDDALGAIAPAVSQPMLGEIRLQWWRDALEQAAQGGAADHPAIAALQPALRAGRLGRDLLETLIASHAADLDPEPFADEAALTAWLDARFGAVMALAAGLLDPAAADPARFVHAGRAWGLALLSRAEPGPRAPWPQAWGDAADLPARVEAALRAARVEIAALPTTAFPAVAYAALARGYARGRCPSELTRRGRIVWAAARGSL